MKIKVVRDWSDASNAWIDVQTYTGLKFPPSGIQYRISFMDKKSVPAQMMVTSNGVSWVDGMGGGYKGKTILNAIVEELQVGSGSGSGSGSGVLYDVVSFSVVRDDENSAYRITITFTLNGTQIDGNGFFTYFVEYYPPFYPFLFISSEPEYGYFIDGQRTLSFDYPSQFAEYLYLVICLPTGAVASQEMLNPHYDPGSPG